MMEGWEVGLEPGLGAPCLHVGLSWVRPPAGHGLAEQPPPSRRRGARSRSSHQAVWFVLTKYLSTIFYQFFSFFWN